jgi:hypothetical protein
MSSILEKNPQLRLRKAVVRRHAYPDGGGEYSDYLSQLQSLIVLNIVGSIRQDIARLLHEQLRQLTHEQIARLLEEISSAALAQHTCEALEPHPPGVFPVPDSKEADPEPGKTGLTDPLAKARQRGQAYAAAEWRMPENLTLMEASERAARSDRAINEDRRHGRLYALVKEGTTRGQRYPAWQFDVDRRRLGDALRPFFEVQASCWTIHDFMLRPSVALDGLSPKDMIADKSKPIDRVVEMAKLRLDGEQGGI